MAVHRQKVMFQNNEGITLSGLLESPDNPTGYALFAHCFTCGKALTSASQISHALVGKGFAVLRFDFTGLGGSDGDFANSNFSSNVDDLVAAAGFMEREYAAPGLLVGHSLGGTAVLAAAARLSKVACVVTLGAPAEPAHVLKQFSVHLDDIRAQGAARVQLAGREFTVKKQFLDDVSHVQLHDQLTTLKKALLIMHSPRDTTVSIGQAELLYTRARHPKSFISLDTADHLLTRQEDARYAAECIAAWAERYLPDPGPADRADTVKPAEGEVVVSMAEGDFLCEIKTSNHHWLSDEPLTVGGGEQGPTPYEQLLAALGACTSMTLRMYARRKKLPLDGLVVALRHSRKHLADGEDSPGGKTLADHIQCDIQVSGALMAEDKARLLEVASLCPVHKTLLNHIEVTTELTSFPSGLTGLPGC